MLKHVFILVVWGLAESNHKILISLYTNYFYYKTFFYTFFF